MAGSLSTLNTEYTDKEQDYGYLDEWGMKFSKLATIFNRNDTQPEQINYNNRGYDYTTDRHEHYKN